VPTGEGDQTERIEVRPDISPGDRVGEGEAGDTRITLHGLPLERQGGRLMAFIRKEPPELDANGEPVGQYRPLKQSGFWFYELHPDTGEVLRRLDDLPVVGQLRGSDGMYVPVQLRGQEFYRKNSSRPVDIQYYRAEDVFMTTPLGKFKYSTPPMGLKPAFFIWTGFPIGALLLAAAAFFFYEAFLSPAAKAERQRRREEQAAEAA
jgi:hypothetical protein